MLDVSDEQLTWADWHGAVQMVLARAHLVRTVRVALVVGTLLFAINQLDVVLHHRATLVTWLKIALTYLVPFCVSNYGILLATHARRTQGNP